MQVAISLYVTKYINSTTILPKSSKQKVNCNTLFENRYIYANAIITCKISCKSTLKYKTIYNLTLLRSLIVNNNNNNKISSSQKYHKKLMDDEIVMAGANCKRYLQNKLGDRKRRRSNLALLDSAEIMEERVIGDTSNRIRQTTRQSTQKQTSTINSLTKSSHKIDVQTRVPTVGSKKYLRSSKQEAYENPKKHCSSSEYDTTSNTESDDNDITNSSSKSTMFLVNGNNHIFNREDNYTNLEEKNFKEQEKGHFSEDFYNEENLNMGVSKKDESIEKRIKLETKTDNEKENENCSYTCSTTSSAKTTSIIDLNENQNTPFTYQKTKEEIGYEGLENVQLENQEKKYATRDDKEAEQYSEQAEENVSDKNQTKYNEVTVDMSKNIDECNIKNENQSSAFATIAPHEIQTHQTTFQQQILFENELNHLSNSICSENSSSSDRNFKLQTENVNKKLSTSNESKQPGDDFVSADIEHTQKHILKSTNATMNTNLLHSTKHPQDTINTVISNSPGDEQYNNYIAEENNGCALKCSTPPTSTLPPINITTPTEQKTSNENNLNLKNNNSCLQVSAIKNECTTEVSCAIIAAADTDNPKTSTNISMVNTDQHYNNAENNLKIDPITINQLGQSTLKIEQDRDDDHNLREKLQNKQKPNENKLINQENFDEYLSESSQRHNAEYVAQQQQANDRIVHQQQQHEKDIIDAADKVYTQIEEQYNQQQQTSSLSVTYDQIINNQQQHQSNPHDHKEHHQQTHDIAVHSHHQPPQNLQHSMQQHYTPEQLYHLQQQEEHHTHLHMQQQHLMQKQEQQQQHNLSRNLQDHRHHQQHSHLMDFLHPQHHHSNVSNTHSPMHQQQIHEVYHDLMIDEFHEEHNTPYKLGLSPSTVKHENQDDGYETSAGDVLTPNSHASSAQSVTPQHHMQHGGLVTNVVKCETKHQEQSIRLQQQSQHNTHGINDRNQNITQELIPNEPTAINTPRDPYHFIDEDLNSATNNSLRNILTPPHSHSRSNQEGGSMNGFMVMQSEPPTSTTLNSNNGVYGLTNSAVHHHLSQNPSTPGPNVDHQQHFAEASTDIVAHGQDSILNLQTKSIQKKRGRKKKILTEGDLTSALERPNPNDVNLIAGFTKTKERKKHDRFNGMSEEEVVKRILPDHLCDNLDIVIIGINPGLFAAYKGHHYAGPGNHFWKCLYLSGLTQEQMNADEDFKLIKYGIGFTNMVQRATKGSADLTRKEIKEGSRILLEKLQRFRPKIAVFNGKLIFEVFSGKKDFNFGRQPECVEGTDTFIWVMPSSSARCAQLPRAADKVPFYAALKKFRDYLNGVIPHIDQSECVFTEERIKQQCEQENYKNQQNGSSATNDATYHNSIQSQVGYSFGAETNSHGAGEGPGPPPSSADNNFSNSFMMSSLVGSQQQHEKKKRGRPKKIKGQEMIDPVTGNKIQVNSQMIGNIGEYANILNLSVVQANSEIPKKKRGRPKKVKTHPDMTQQDIAQSTAMLSQKPNIMSIQSLTSDITQGSPHHHIQGLQANHQHVALYSTPPPAPHQRNIYSPMASPMASPSINCSYTTNTPPSQPHHDKLSLTSLSNGRESSKSTNATDLVQTAHHQHNPIQDQHFGESPPPSSPNISTVDFEPPTASTTASSIVSENANTDLSAMHQRLHSNHNQRSRFNSPISGEATPDHNATENFQQWLSPQPNHNIHSPAAASTMFVNSPQQPSLNYHDQSQQQIHAIQQQQPQHQEMHSQWPLRHQSRYDDLTNSSYLLSSQLHQTHSPLNHPNHSQHSGSDVARKSLSGLESLVDQIPTISESESIALSSAAAVNAQVAAAAAVESRLQGMQNSSLSESQIGDDFSSITGSQNLLTASNSSTSAPSNNNQILQSNNTSNLLNSNFSVSNLAASSASSNNTNNNSNSNNHDNYDLSSNDRPLATNSNAYHPNLMAAAVLAAAAAANTPTNLSTQPASSAAGTTNHHTSMYMDAHANLTTHVPVNSIYPTATPTSHHHSALPAHHHHAAIHYGSVQHSAAADYTTSNNPYAAANQSNMTTSHTLHMPSPNYPYGYPTAASQSNYSAYPHSHHVNPHHHHGHPHAHHLAMFDRLKPSDITGYSSGF